MEGIFFIDKPKGMSSHDVLRFLKRAGIKGKIGHAGTLDPAASGLLIVAIGKATRKLQSFAALSKTYHMEILVGRRTDTGDLEGKVLEEKAVGKIQADEIGAVLTSLVGDVELSVPAYSALKYRGRPRYSYARRGETIPEKRRKTKIFSLTFEGTQNVKNARIISVVLRCSTGTYARAVAEEIGRRLGYPATVHNLRRTQIGSIGVAMARPLDSFSSFGY